MNVNELRNKIEHTIALPFATFVPCNEADIQLLEDELNLKLPKAYQEFLLWMGMKANNILQGSEWLFHDLPKIRGWAIQLLEGNGLKSWLPDDALVFFMHQGYQFAFMRTSEGDDPPVYYFNEMYPSTDFTKMYNKYSDFLTEQIDQVFGSSEEH